MRRLNLGCGPYKKDGYINLDWRKSVQPDVLRDIRKGLPFDSDSVDAVLASHFLEHLTYNQMMDCLEECYRVMKNKAPLEIVVPIMEFKSLDHLQHLSADAFDILGRDPEYFERNFKWNIAKKSVIEKPNGQQLHITLEAVKE